MSKLNIKPLGDRVLLEPYSDKQEKGKTETGIYIPDTAEKERSEKGKVAAVGPGKMNKNGEIMPLSVKTGQIVLFSKYSPTEIKVDNKEYLIVKEEDILAIIE